MKSEAESSEVRVSSSRSVLPFPKVISRSSPPPVTVTAKRGRLVTDGEAPQIIVYDGMRQQIDARNADSLTTSNIHQETLRELKQINTCFILVAYPILTERGDLLDTRLRHAL